MKMKQILFFLSWFFTGILCQGCINYPGYIDCVSGPSFFNGINVTSSAGAWIEGCVFQAGTFFCPESSEPNVLWDLQVDDDLKAYIIATDEINSWTEDYVSIEGCSVSNGGINCPSVESSFFGINSDSVAGSYIEGCSFLAGSFSCLAVETSSQVINLEVGALGANTIAVNAINNLDTSYIQVGGCVVEGGAVNCTSATSNFNAVTLANGLSILNSGIPGYVPSILQNIELSTTFTLEFEGAFSTGQVATFTALRIGPLVVMQWSLIQTTCTHSNSIITANSGSIPPRFRPVSTVVFPTLVVNNSETVLGYIQFGPNGSVQIGVEAPIADFATTGDCGILYSATFFFA